MTEQQSWRDIAQSKGMTYLQRLPEAIPEGQVKFELIQIIIADRRATVPSRKTAGEIGFHHLRQLVSVTSCSFPRSHPSYPLTLFVAARGGRRQIWLANCWPNLRAHLRAVSWLTAIPRAASSSYAGSGRYPQRVGMHSRGPPWCLGKPGDDEAVRQRAARGIHIALGKPHAPLAIHRGEVHLAGG